MGYLADGLRDAQSIKERIKIGNGVHVEAVKEGALPLMVHQVDGNTMDITLKDYKYMPDFKVCLFSLMKAIHGGWNITNEGTVLVLSKGELNIKFDRITKTHSGVLCGVNLLPRLGEEDIDYQFEDKAYPTVDNPVSTSESGGDGNGDPKLKPHSSKNTKNTKKDPIVTWDINRFHKVFGHASEEAMRNTANHYGWRLTGTLDPCEACQMSNAQQKKVPKSTETQSQVPGERIFVDMSTVSEHKSLGGAKVWLCAVDDATGCTWNKVMKSKAEAPSKLMGLFRKLHDRGNPVSFVRLDDASELRKLAKLCEGSAEKFLRDIKFEFTSRDTPQRNGKVERKLAVMTRRLRAILNAAKLSKELRQVLWGECIMYLEDIENLLQSRMYDEPAYQSFFKKTLEGMEHLRQFGEVAYVKFGDKIKGKLEDRGVPMLYLGRPRNHSADTYRLLNLATNKVIHSRDATWLNQVYGEWKKLDLPTSPEVITMMSVESKGKVSDTQNKGDFRDVIANPESTNDKEDKPTPLPDIPIKASAPRRTVSTRAHKVHTTLQPTQEASRELTRIGSDISNPEAKSLADTIRESTSAEEPEIPEPETGGEPAEPSVDTAAPAFAVVDRFGGDIGSYADYGMSATDVDPSKYKDMFENPKTYDEAWNHPDPFQQERWREAITKELNKMEEKGVWRKIKRDEMEEGRRCVKHKWVLEIKRSGRFRARLVACGYSQIPGIDYNDVYSPVVNDITFRIAMTYMTWAGMDTVIFDVETAFLHGELEELIYMDCPEGMSTDGSECLVLDKTIYGLVQASNRYKKKFTDVLESLGFETCPSDPCFYKRGEGQNRLFLLMYVDDNLLMGKREAIDYFLTELKSTEFTFTVEETLNDYLSCEVLMDSKERKTWIGQPHMVKKIEKTFGEEVSKLKNYATPGTPGFKVTVPKDDEQTLGDDLQSRCRTGVGQVMYLIKHSRPDLMSVVRELSKVLGKATEAAYKELLRCIKFVLCTKNKGLKIDPAEPVDGVWKLEVFSDSDWAGDPDDRKSVGCYIIFLNGAPIAWRARKQKVVSLSSSEAEFYACSEAVREVPFVAQLLLFMGIPIQLPVQVWVDNVGAIFMTENRTSSSRTRHMDTRWWHVIQLQDEEGLIKVGFVRTKDNVSDIGTKNVDTQTYERLEGKLLKSKT